MSTTQLADALREGFSGQVLEPGQPGYDESRLLFNPVIDRRPAVVARCATTAAGAAAVNAARDGGLVVAVRCGGHSFPGLSTCDDGMQIDLRGLRSITVDADARTARAGGGALWGEFDAATQAHGLHTPGGRITTTGVGGFTTGGGYGWTSSKYGLTCDNLIAAEVVLADGQIVTANERDNGDLFWGIRGGGGNFGIVTEFQYRLQPLGPIVLAGLALWPIDRATEVVRAWRDYVDGAPDELSTACAILTAPPAEFVPDQLKGQVALGMIAMYVGDPEKGATVMQPLKALGPVVDLIQPMPYTAFQAVIDPMAPKGHRSYWRGEYLKGLSDAAIDAFIRHGSDLAAAGTPLNQMIVFRIGQGVAATPDDATAWTGESS